VQANFEPPLGLQRVVADAGAHVLARRGYDDNAPFEAVSVVGGTRQVVAYELDRIEIQLPFRGRYDGYLIAGDQRRALPIGSTLDRSTGRFYWQPGPGFIGKYTLLFEPRTSDLPNYRTTERPNDRTSGTVTIDIILQPRHPNGSDVQMAIDLPAPGDVPGSFLVAGWAIDRGAPVGTGIDTLHVWAYPNPGSGTPPIFLGAVRLGGVRPDVGAYYGQRFADSAYHLAVTGLPPGSYDLAVFPHSTVTDQFEAAAVVRVTIK
jgi:hypothetical protein